MERLSCTHQPTLRQLLATGAMAEAHVVSGEDLIERPIVQVTTQLDPPPVQGSLVVSTTEALLALKNISVKGLCGVIYIQSEHYRIEPDHSRKRGTRNDTTSADGEAALLPARAVAGPGAIAGAHAVTGRPSGGAPASGLATSVEEDGKDGSRKSGGAQGDPVLEQLLTRCRTNDVPLILIPGFGDPSQTIEDIRLSFLKETKMASARIQAVLLSVVLEEGLDGLVDQLHEWLQRPIAIETADFKLLASRGMGATPVRQQKHLSDEALDTIQRLKENGAEQSIFDSFHLPLRLGRRLSFPLLYAGNNIAGYISITVKASDQEESFIWYMQPAALAAMVDIVHRLKGDFGLSLVQKNLLMDLISGRPMSATDQERLARHFGFDLCDGFFVFAVEAFLDQDGPGEAQGLVRYPEEALVSTEVEGTRVYVIPYSEDSEQSWQEEAAELVKTIKDMNGQCHVQLGAGRKVASLMELHDAYCEARQALIVGSMIHQGREFSIGYGELGVKRLLYLIIDHPESDRFYKETLAPLEAYDEEWETDLLDSLRVYVNEGANLNSTARALFIHRHTLRYRLEQIADILKVDIDSQEVLLNLQIAFLIRDMKKQSE